MCDPCDIPMLSETALERLVSTKKLPCPYCDEIYKLFSVRFSWRIIDLTRWVKEKSRIRFYSVGFHSFLAEIGLKCEKWARLFLVVFLCSLNKSELEV